MEAWSWKSEVEDLEVKDWSCEPGRGGLELEA